jgi:hypothetical protein
MITIIFGEMKNFSTKSLYFSRKVVKLSGSQAHGLSGSRALDYWALKLLGSWALRLVGSQAHGLSG